LPRKTKLYLSTESTGRHCSYPMHSSQSLKLTEKKDAQSNDPAAETKQERIQIFGSVRMVTNKPAADDPVALGESSVKIPQLTTRAAEHRKRLKFAPNIPEIDLTNERLREVPPGISGLQKLKKLTLRTNAIPKISHLKELYSLTELDLYENQISHIEGLTECPRLTSLDLSFNQIRAVENLSPLSKSLTHLYLIQNKITKIDGLGDLKELQLLEMGSNRIRAIENLGPLQNLTELFLGRNKITDLKGLQGLKRLEKLSMQSNRVVTVGPALKGMTQLKEIYLSHNGILKVEGFETLVNLEVLDLGGNRIKKLENLENLVQLRELWVNNNFLVDFKDLTCIKSKKLNTIYLEQNPLSKDPDYQDKVMAALPSVRQLDADVYEVIEKKDTAAVLQ